MGFASNVLDIREGIKFSSLFLMLLAVLIFRMRCQLGLIFWLLLLVIYSALSVLSIIFYGTSIIEYYNDKQKIILILVGKTPGDLGVFVYFLVFSLIFYLNPRRFSKFAIVLGLGIICLEFVGSQTALVGLTIALLGYMILLIVPRYFSVLMVLSFFALLLSPLSLFALDHSHLAELAAEYNSLTTSRSYLWEAFVLDYQDRPLEQQIFGTSLDRQLVSIEIIRDTSDVHSTAYDLLNYFGAVGFLIVNSLWLFSFSLCPRNLKPILLGLASIMVVSSLFKYPGTIPLLMFMMTSPLWLVHKDFGGKVRVSNSCR